MEVYKLYPMLKFLTLTGYEEGEYQFVGNQKAWKEAEFWITFYEENHNYPE